MIVYSWYILGELLNALPYPLAIAAIKNGEVKDTLRHAASPIVLDKICNSSTCT